MTAQNQSAARLALVHFNAYGNLAVKHERVSLSGFLVGDTVDFFILPRGAKVYDSIMRVDGTGTATSTLKLGLKGLNGTTQDDDDYFNAAKLLDAAGRHRADNTAVVPVKLSDDTYVRGTVGVANCGAGAVYVDVIVFYEAVGE